MRRSAVSLRVRLGESPDGRKRTPTAFGRRVARSGVAVLLLFAVYAAAELGGMAIRQVVITSISAYGWVAWYRRRDAVHGVMVRRGTAGERWCLLTVLLLGSAVFGALLRGLDACWGPGRRPGSSSAPWWLSGSGAENCWSSG
ncbi:nicotinamide mononucleotide transporter [Actinopolyspora mzabensis]|uniref:nicotinamide mononucleotide transporter n=1 Tax=Actinopolyspora mzabensis TaxID=995066 RepID=UPI001C40B5CF|nr:nicotinamide mononucleotide transporter [Actinopolyspora mzabensis]